MNKYSREFSKINSFCNLTLEELRFNKKPDSLYNPINHILNVRGKGIRALLVCISYSILGGRLSNVKNLLLAIESFHSFSLIHDDIMDNALLRRGKPTINNKWSNNQALLSGDALLMFSYSYLLELPFPKIKLISLIKYFNKTAIKICEGQQLDFDMQQINTVSLSDYLSMIDLKTSELIVFSLTAPYLLCQSNIDLNAIKEIGYNLGRLFQMQDDYLDLFGDQKKTGKILGGDVIEGKKTFLYLVALENLRDTKKEQLIELYNSSYHPTVKITNDEFNQNKLLRVIKIYQSIHLKKIVSSEINSLGLSTQKLIMQLNIDSEKKKLFIEFFETILHRKL